jgi:hypothetical protein
MPFSFFLGRMWFPPFLRSLNICVTSFFPSFWTRVTFYSVVLQWFLISFFLSSFHTSVSFPIFFKSVFKLMCNFRFFLFNFAIVWIFLFFLDICTLKPLWRADFRSHCYAVSAKTYPLLFHLNSCPFLPQQITAAACHVRFSQQNSLISGR